MKKLAVPNYESAFQSVTLYGTILCWVKEGLRVREVRCVDKKHSTCRNLGKDVEQEWEGRQVDPNPLSTKSLLHVLGQGAHFAGNVHGQEAEAEKLEQHQGLRDVKQTEFIFSEWWNGQRGAGTITHDVDGRGVG